MDNDNKINTEEHNDKIHQEVMLFLGDELETIHKRSGTQNYDINKEYGKTRKNKSPFATLLLVACFVIVIGISFLMNKVISSHNDEITVSLQEFDDLNLKGLLDTVTTAQANYDNAVKNKIAIEAEISSRKQRAKETLDNDIFVIDSMNYKFKKVYNDKVAAARQKYNDTIRSINSEFSSQLTLAEKEVETYKAQLDEFDAAKVKAAREKEKALDSERQLREIELKKLESKYEAKISELNKTLTNLQSKHSEELRYAAASISRQYGEEIKALDPTLEDENASEIIANANGYVTPDFETASYLEDTEIISPAVVQAINDYQEIYDNYKYIDDVVASIPQKNSIPEYVKAARILVNDMGEAFLDTTVTLYEENESLSTQIRESQEEILKLQSYYESTLANIMQEAKTSAILIFAEDYEKMSVYVTPKARYLVTEEGADAEIKAPHAVKGKIKKAQESDSFYFEVALDKDGNPAKVNFEELTPGLLIKILSK